MKIKLIITTILVVLAFPALADFETVSRAYEVNASSLTVPPSQNSRISFNQCEDCETTTVRLTSKTRYSVNGRTVRFDRFREAVQSARQSDQAGVFLLHHLQSDAVLSVSIIL